MGFGHFASDVDLERIRTSLKGPVTRCAKSSFSGKPGTEVWFNYIATGYVSRIVEAT